MMKRGERSVTKRLDHLKDRNTNGYKRLFCTSAGGGEEIENTKGIKLTKCSDVLSRIKFDHGLVESEFMVDVYDRVDNVVERVPFDKENTSVSGKERQFVFAVPEHRITAIYFKERCVWGRGEERVDLVKSIYEVIGGYEEWEKERNRIRKELQMEVDQASFKLALEAGKDVWESWEGVLQNVAGVMVEKGGTFRRAELENFAKDMLEGIDFPSSIISYLSSLAKLAKEERTMEGGEVFLRIATEIERQSAGDETLPTMQRAGMIEMVSLDEKDIEESFVRGGGAGGQKVNKTASKVVLLHKPTGVRVACQKTRSLEQNRKIARKLLRERLDEFLQGGEARSAVKAEVKKSKKARNKARSARRRRKKMDGGGGEEEQEQEQEQEEEEE
ncbi:hypothetical protein TrRE_jg8756 [Triparma retinervis]|uniref:Prokaryotic-type class I peptide chain release factors domain-containing protein n=1 Tax=Triparma retinervis TaxID=2557542 RepID=A0A9W7A0Z1_9STRA|nr:hypothetical protein TrRE_jg8756 [Triparma retinervis]